MSLELKGAMLIVAHCAMTGCSKEHGPQSKKIFSKAKQQLYILSVKTLDQRGGLFIIEKLDIFVFIALSHRKATQLVTHNKNIVETVS